MISEALAWTCLITLCRVAKASGGHCWWRAISQSHTTTTMRARCTSCFSGGFGNPVSSALFQHGANVNPKRWFQDSFGIFSLSDNGPCLGSRKPKQPYEWQSYREVSPRTFPDWHIFEGRRWRKRAWMGGRQEVKGIWETISYSLQPVSSQQETVIMHQRTASQQRPSDSLTRVNESTVWPGSCCNSSRRKGRLCLSEGEFCPNFITAADANFYLDAGDSHLQTCVTSLRS